MRASGLITFSSSYAAMLSSLDPDISGKIRASSGLITPRSPKIATIIMTLNEPLFFLSTMLSWFQEYGEINKLDSNRSQENRKYRTNRKPPRRRTAAPS